MAPGMKLNIAFVNDVHGYLEPHTELFYNGAEEVTATVGGYARLATMINDIKTKRPITLVFDGGDTFHGTLPVVESKGEVLLPILNAIGFDAMVGHWDFAYGPERLKKLQAELSYPVLGVNVYNEDGSRFLEPYKIIPVEDVQIAVIGICSNIIDKTMPEQFSHGLKITDGVNELPTIIDEVKSKGADIIILLSHNGFPQDCELLSKLDGIDVCLSAHTHNRLYEAVEINGAVVIQCGCHGSLLGHLELTIDNKKRAGYTYELVSIDESIEPNIPIEKMVAEAMKPYRHLQESVVGETTTILHRYNTLNSTMDNLLLAAIAAEAQVNVAFSNGWRYGAPIAAGPITKWDLYNIVPMNPVVSTVELTGKEIKTMLEENLERTFSAEPMKQMGGYVKRAFGIHVKLRIENPRGHRMQQVFVGTELMNTEKTYKVAFITSQGVPEKFGKNRIDLDVTAVDAMQRFLKHAGKFGSEISTAFDLI
jgi:S-sulfosulfanyl-L-cysteine sulfohydrolase